MKKIIFTSAITLGVLLGLSANVSANAEVDSQENYIETIQLEDGGEMTIEIRDLTPLEIQEANTPKGVLNNLIEVNAMQRGASIPSQKKKITGKTKYNFSGSTDGRSNLYTNYKFYGSTSYKVVTKNTGPDAVKVNAKRATKSYGTTKISKNKSGTITFSNIKSSTQWYILFTGGAFGVSGTVSKG